MIGIINSIINIYILGLLLYGIIIMLDIRVPFVTKGKVPIYDIPINYIRKFVKPVEINSTRIDLSFPILFVLLKLVQRIL